MAQISVSRQTKSLLLDATASRHLPPDLLQVARNYASPNLLDAIAQAALIPVLTDRVFAHFEDVFADICARWILNSGVELRTSAAAFARILPFAPNLSQFLTCSPVHAHQSTSVVSSPLRLQLLTLDQSSTPLTEQELLESLITAWRLLNFDIRIFTPIVSLSYMQQLFSHPSPAVRCTAIRIYCLLLRAADAKLESLLQEYCGAGEIIGLLDGSPIDYVFLSLHEHARVQIVITLRQQLSKQSHTLHDGGFLHQLTPYVLSCGKVLLPRPDGPSQDSSSLVMTATTAANLENFASMLQKPGPILLHGLAGSGKTALVHQVARQLGMYSNMVTLHLNEQTDAKMLIGLYSTNSKPGSFQWRPGVLTTAVKEGRWVLVEDLDRAPTEVLSTLLPLIERRELLIPSRGERICAADSFRLFATIRTSLGIKGRETLPNLVGMRFWQSLYTEPTIQSELEQIILHLHPMLHKFAPGILAVYNRLSQMASNPSLMSRGRSVMSRTLNLRDLLKWSRRLTCCLKAAGMTTGQEPMSDTTRDYMFMDALDCFIGSCPDIQLGKQLAYAIAEEMHMSRERADHYLAANIPPLDESNSTFSIGRVQLPKKRKMTTRAEKPRQPFASTCHAKRLLEQIAIAVKLEEPVLLVGETGIGKTTVVQQLADSLGHKLVAVNLSQQSEVGDLLGGFKPVNVRSLAVPLKEQFEDLFAATGISASKNQKYLEQIGKCFARNQWSRLSKLWQEAPPMFLKILADLERLSSEPRQDDTQPLKRRKTQSKLHSLKELRPRWDNFSQNLEQFNVQISGGSQGFAFSFVEGNLIKAVRNGDWVLLDEINLASPDTLESIADLLTGSEEQPSILLSETGEIEKITAHPDFRIFGAMNPATDIGKRDLPTGIRSRFTELYVNSPDADIKDLVAIIKSYLGSSSVKNEQAADDIARLYLNTKRMADEKRLVDGANEVPHFSLRTLTRVLSYVKTIAPLYGVRRALYEGFAMGFLTLLDRDSEKLLIPLIHHHLFDKHGDAHALLSQPPKHPNDGKQYVKFQNQNRDRQYWLFQGGQTPIEREDYIITPYVERNLLNLVRATSTRRFPILIQGPTSAGKTSMIEYLANYTGNKFVRINNHEHTDLQEYLGTYISGSDGKLRFQEGLLVQAMRQGHWIVLDELNLAPTDVLEALNRLLDDNRELLIPETQEVVRPHENFILFATQNPPGLYGGRKVLSRAFRNRFLELHFDDIPEDELEFILQKRSRNTSPPDCRRIVAVYKELSRLRQTSRLFEQKDSFATLRDLFRWALREAETREDIAAHGFMLLAERVRNAEERIAVKEIIEKIFKVALDAQQMYSADFAPELKQLTKQQNSQGVVWTHAMRRLYVLVYRALRNNEPVLLVGETGCGKTTVCQVLAEALKTELHIVNAHQNTETGDLIGSQRPVRNRGAIIDALDADLTSVLKTLEQPVPGSTEEKLDAFRSLDKTLVAKIATETMERIANNETRVQALFEWSDGALVEAMKEGHFFLLDEISLADDSVLERLNSVLEPQRTLLLAEKGIDNSLVVASDGFQFFATMNPGGDFGKKELSPALRNRFTEVWVPPLSNSQDIYDIVRTRLGQGSKHLVEAMVQFAAWFGATFRPMATTQFSVREILGWVQFMNSSEDTDPLPSFVQGASAIFIDSIGANPSAIVSIDAKTVHQQRLHCIDKLGQLIGRDLSESYGSRPRLEITDDFLTVGSFSIPRSPKVAGAQEARFAFDAPTTTLNLMRVVRALQIHKPILLEGSPGVGKTTLVEALASACGRPLTRINLSDQTDLMDLFGTDVPVEGQDVGRFAWRDAPFLKAMQRGEWVLLDEMNLASQSVLEGLNACLDHRGEVYIAELDQVFKRHADFRLFAAQNPHHQGGGRKGLPASFVNRFIVVYADVLTDEDLELIVAHNFPNKPRRIVRALISFISELDRQLAVDKSFGSQGGPWEFNLRDALRWMTLFSAPEHINMNFLDDFLDVAVLQRFRTDRDRQEVNNIYCRIMGQEPQIHDLYHDVNSSFAQAGQAVLGRNKLLQPEKLPCICPVPRLAELESLMICVQQNMPCILSGPSGSGKSALLQYVAALAGKPLAVFPMNADIDAMDLVGGFEQADPLRQVNEALRHLRDILQEQLLSTSPSETPPEALRLLQLLVIHSNDSHGLDAIRIAIEDLYAAISPESSVAHELIKPRHFLNQPLHLQNPRFEWLDGIIVKAMEMGQWLVLDNANMCNASVLDRLNSLLEPKGVLYINEHCDSNGQPRVIEPHPDFRIFLTTDPRHGELSRAMRNRAVEIYIHTTPKGIDSCFGRICSIESSLQRYKKVTDYCQEVSTDVSSLGLQQPALGLLSLHDVSILGQFVKTFSSDSASIPFPMEGFQQFLSYCQSAVGIKALKLALDAYSRMPQEIPVKSRAQINENNESIPSRIAYTQPIHTLANFTLMRRLVGSPKLYCTGVKVDSYHQLFLLQGLVDSHRGQARSANISSLNRLQRSLISERVAAVSKDSTVRLGTFLSATIEAMLGYLGSAWPEIAGCKIQTSMLRFLEQYLGNMIGLSTQDNFDEARFQAYWDFGIRTLQREIEALKPATLHSRFVSTILRCLEASFDGGFKLTTGLSMEVLWQVLRPMPYANKQELDKAVELKQLASRFDSVRWRSSASIADLAKAQRTLEEAYEIIRTKTSSANELVSDLSTAIEALETQIGDQTADLQPYLSCQFEHVRQLFMLQALDAGCQNLMPDSDLTILSNVSTGATALLASTKGPAGLLQFVDCLVNQDTYTWHGTLTNSLWNKLTGVHNVSLRSLAILEDELPAMGRYVSTLSADIAGDPILKLNGLLERLLSQVFAIHGTRAEETMDVLYSSNNLGSHNFDDLVEQKLEVLHFRNICREHFIPTLSGLSAARTKVEKRAYWSALAWIHFSMGFIKLYVPDRIFDPQLRPRVELDFYEELKANLLNKLSSLREFGQFFNGQRVSLRTEILQDELDELVPPQTEHQDIFRPEVSELSSLHVELANVIKVVTGPSLATVVQSLEAESAESGNDGLRLVKANVERLLDRLSARFEAYQDMTRPAVNALRCLVVGISLCDAVVAKSLSPATQELVDVTPFLGNGRCDGINGRWSAKSFEYLDLIALLVSVEGLDGLSTESRESIFECFHGFYNDWCKRLEADRKAEETKTSLYRFRGTFEDEEEIDEHEFNQLFPSYDDDDEDSTCRPTAKEDEIRTTSLKMAETHNNIFYQRQDAQAAMRGACIAVGQRVSDEMAGYSSIESSLNARLVVPTYLLLDEKLAELKSTTVGASYNFYSDANLVEARQLVSLVHSVKTRFRQLQLVDEIGHFQPLEDVVQSCEKVLQQIHHEPLAKLMPKVEQLHAHVYEWQFGGWASKTFGVAALYDALTNTIIRWRRLELSTWSKLFDMEMHKCREDAYSWWFVAYQVVIAVPLSMMDSPSKLQEYAVSLIQSLELYFSTSIVGQFKTRVALLRQLLGHLHLLVKNYPQAQVISHAVGNFVDYYTRYEALADTAIQKGRAPIETKMKDVLLMASWKDTNINALRESARKSHQKLFRLVRKFRGVLGQQMKGIMQQGLPDDEVTRATQIGLQDAFVEVSELQLEPLHQALPGWLEQHRRLANSPTTVSVLKRIMDSVGMASDAASALDDFTSTLNTSMAELRKETPTVLSDETKDQVKHLKTRKRKLFADTLRDLRQMGLSYNLAQDKLEAQESLAAILTLLPRVGLPGSTALQQAEYYLHKTLDLAPKVRLAAREHSEDLTGAEVGRSVGFVEGMIYFLLNQRGQLSKACGALVLLQSASHDFKQLGNTDAVVGLSRRAHGSDCSQLLPWLSQMLQFATKSIQAYIRLGHGELEALVEELQKWTNRSEGLLRSSKKLCKLPEQLTSARHDEFEAQVDNHFASLRAELNRYMVEKPNMAMILQQVEPWTHAKSQSFDSQETTRSIMDCAEAVSNLTDSILVAVERANKVIDAPKGEDGSGWLKKQNNELSTVLQQLHMSDVEKSVRHCIDLVQQVNLAKPNASAAMITMFGLASPILSNFTLLCSQSVNRAMELHRATSNMAFNLTKAFMQIASQGFCTPQEPSDEKSGDAGQLESGTGLGDGDGAEDISKDVQPDEDLSELAQEANKEQRGEIEDEKDAVDMADEELEGEMGSVDGADDDEEKGSQKEDEENGDEMDEEAGNVDDLDPTAVDEKMWDGDDEKAEKDQQGNKQAGQKQDDEQMATDPDIKQGEAEEKQDDGKREEEMEGQVEEEEEKGEEAEAAEEEEEQGNAAAQEELNRQDQNVDEREALELPEDMDLDFDDQGSELSDDEEMEDLSEADDELDRPKEEQEDGGEEDESMGAPEVQPAGEDKMEENEGEADEEGEDKIGGEDEVQEEMQAEEEGEEEQESEQQARETDKAKTDAENAAPSDVKSSGMDQSAEAKALDEQFQADAAQQETGDMGDGAADQDCNAGNAGTAGKQNKTVEEREQEAEAQQESGRSNPFRKLGDALEKWHRQQSDIQNAQPKTDDARDEKNQDGDVGRREFEHLQNDDDAADTQAMGKAEQDEVAPIDEAMAIDEETRDASTRLMDGEEGDEAKEEHGADEMDVDEDKQAKGQEADNEGSGAPTQQGKDNKGEDKSDPPATKTRDETDEAEAVDETLHGSADSEAAALGNYEECVAQWSDYQRRQATKLSGAFRSGKRLNMKRIIPYIASSYKRDKIWMRRSTPTRRRHQVVVCVDDSKSMGETASGRLALESLVMVTRALGMVEAGEVGVVGFGTSVFEAQPLSATTSSSASAASGGRVLQRFGFGQQGTDVAQLMRSVIDMLVAARQQQQQQQEEQWQLALVLSDGLTPSAAHEAIRRLVREAVQERVMVVFVVLDAGPQSVVELREARFDGEAGVRVERYLDSFPFENYLIVRDVGELPGALAGLLRMWFAEVAR
ncbi:hypothetical protein CDD82_4928 [Ophiocordyceps australis]|uniref:Midasin n=1 Tax=Ophiocordyceps australis TaxID=1399860 RepID=A0A2C5ZSG8_9HYPO|nr:hypothetical protein CDD82_4928 [Ophiocordyceps australis]